MPRKLFLLGGSAAFDVAAAEFVPASGKRDANVALLLQGGHNWQKYVPEYIRPWEKYGATRYEVIVPNEHGQLNLAEVTATLDRATGVFIGGGNTAAYRRLYATDPVRGLLRKCYADGIPYAGCSAGTLIAPDICAFHPGESDDDSIVADGLGLIGGCLVGVHFTADNTLPHLLAAMAATHTAMAWGIDDSACVMFEDEQFNRVLGRTAYKITMTDFKTRTHIVQQLEP